MIDAGIKRGIFRWTNSRHEKVNLTSQFFKRLQENIYKNIDSFKKEWNKPETANKIIGVSAVETVAEYFTREQTAVEEKELVDVASMVTMILGIDKS